MSNDLIEKNENNVIDNISLLTNGELFDRMMTLSRVMANSGMMVPEHFRDKPDACMAVVMQAARWGLDPFMVAQKTHIVSGTLGYEAQLVNTVVNKMAPTKDRIHYDWFGPWEKVIGKFVEKTSKNNNKYIAPGWSLDDEKDVGIRVWATLKGEDEPRILTLMLSQVQVRNSTLWASDPRQQLAYLGIKRWVRLYCPDVLAGVYSPDELEEPTLRVEKDVTPPSVMVAEIPPETTTEGSEQLQADELAEALSAALGEATTQEEAAAIEQRIAAHKATLGDRVFDLRGKAQMKRNGFKAITEISTAFDRLDENDAQACEKLSRLIKNRENVLPSQEFERFTLALKDIRG